MTDRTYSISLKGEQHTYGIDAFAALTWEQACDVLSDLTGYKAEYLRKTEFDRLGYATVKPAACSFGEVPQFHVRSSDGGKP